MTNLAPAGSGTQTRLRVALGTFVSIEAQAAEEALSLSAIDAAFAAVVQVQQLMHPSRGTDLAALSGACAGASVKVHRWTWEVLDLCSRLNRASEGTFDPCLGDAEGRMSDLLLLPSDTVVTRARVHIDLGGIAKGYAVDRALDALRAAGCIAGLVNAGGDLALFGHHSREIVCKGEREDTVVELRDAALATSVASLGEPRAGERPVEHRGYYDGRRRHTRISGQATVIAPRAALADGLTKCVLAAPPLLHARLLARFGARLVSHEPAKTPVPVPGQSA